MPDTAPERTILAAIIHLFATGSCYECAFKYSKMKTHRATRRISPNKGKCKSPK